MSYTFNSGYYKEGNRMFMKIPFNVWDTCGKKGLIPVKVFIEEISFECKLIPKGNGGYVIPVKNDIFNKLNVSSEYFVKFIILDQLTRINKNSPYTKDNPIRYIDSINYLKQGKSGYCMQACIAMLANISIDEAAKIMKSNKFQGSISKVFETLDYFGFSYNNPVYTHGKKIQFPKCCIINVRGDKINHLLVYFDGAFFDPTEDIANNYEYEKIISYIEII